MEQAKHSRIRAILTSTLVGLLGCDNEIKYGGFKQHPVEQVFRDYYGYRTYYTDESAVLQENIYSQYTCFGKEFFPQDTPLGIKSQFKYLNSKGISTDDAVKVIKDLNNGERGYALILQYRCEGMNKQSYLPDPASFVEIHLPRDAQLSPGYSTTGGKNPTFPPMGEIK